MIRFTVHNSINHHRKVRLLQQLVRSRHSGPPVLEAGFGKLLVFLTPIAAGASVVAYAKYDDKFRQTLVKNVPGADAVLKVLLQEENPLDKITKEYNNVTKKIEESTSTVTNFFGMGGNKNDTPKEVKKELPKRVRSHKRKHDDQLELRLSNDLESSLNVKTSKRKHEKAIPLMSNTKSNTNMEDSMQLNYGANNETPATQISKKAEMKSSSVPSPPLPEPTVPSTKSKKEESLIKETKSSPQLSTTKPPATATKTVTPAAVAVAVAAPAAPKLDKLPTNIEELEHAVEVAANLASNEYKRAVDILKQYKADVTTALDHAVDKLDTTIWTSLKNKTSARDSALNNAELTAREATDKILKLQDSVNSLSHNVAPDAVEGVKNRIKLIQDQLNKCKDDLYNMKDLADSSEKYWRKIEEARNHFVDEIESLFPGVNLSDKKMDLSKDELDLFFVHAYSYVMAYRKELEKMHAEGEARIRRALDALRSDDKSEAMKQQLEYDIEKEKQLLRLQNQKELFKQQAVNDKLLRDQLRRQAEAHVDHIKNALTVKEKELRRQFERELHEKVSAEQMAYKQQLAGMIGKLKGMDAAIQARADTDKMVHQSQALWSACQAFWYSVRIGEPGLAWQLKLRPLKLEVAAVKKAASKDDELVSVVLDSLPKQALDRGVYPEDALRERFLKVEKMAHRLALVPTEGGRLPTYLLSYLQSMLISSPSHPISEAELKDHEVDFSKFDTYDILNRARYWVDHGNLTQAVKYMNLLQGASRKVAEDWIKEARLLLETQQAANTLMAHAASSGLLFL